jgi:thiol-disulfide isomerase/thioredoxin
MTASPRALLLATAALLAACTEPVRTEQPSTPASPDAAPNDAPIQRDPPRVTPAKAATPQTSASAAAAPPERATIELGPWQGELMPLLEQHVERAKSQHLTPFVEFYADWCPPCKALKKYWNEPSMAAAFKGTYVIVLNVDDWQDKLKGTGFVPRTIPVFYAVDEKGKPTGRKITGDDWGKNKDVPERMAPVLERFFAGTAP